MHGRGIWCFICPWKHALKASKWRQPRMAPIFAHLAPRHMFVAHKFNTIFNNGDYFINKVMLKCWTKLLLYSTSLLVIRNEPQNYISLTENISKICIIPLSGATRWRFSRLTWGYYKQFYIMRLLSKMCGQVVYLYFQQRLMHKINSTCSLTCCFLHGENVGWKVMWQTST
jgi:hypothetical protein